MLKKHHRSTFPPTVNFYMYKNSNVKKFRRFLPVMIRPFLILRRFFSSLRLIIEESSMSLAKRNHGKYFCRFLNLLPPRLSCHDSTRATIAFFSISGLDVLDLLDLLSDESKQNIIEWFYSLLMTPEKGNDVRCSGFMVRIVQCIKFYVNKSVNFISVFITIILQGATTLNIENAPDNCPINAYKWGHLAMTYTSIATLVILGDDLSRLDRRAIIEGDSLLWGSGRFRQLVR